MSKQSETKQKQGYEAKASYHMSTCIHWRNRKCLNGLIKRKTISAVIGHYLK